MSRNDETARSEWMARSGEMTKNKNERDRYGAYLAALIKAHNFSKVEFAKRIDVSRTYLFDLLKGRVKPPAHEMQEKIISALELRGKEKEVFYNETAAGRSELPKDVFDYLYNNADEISAIRERMRA